MKAYYLLAAVAASLAALAVAAGLHGPRPEGQQQQMAAETEAEAWFIGA